MALTSELTVLTGVCPICGEPAVSEHHIKPRDVGGSDEPRNKVWLCARCHNIVEMIYDETGVEYNPALVNAIQREFGLGEPTRKFPRRPKLKYSLPKRRSAYYFRDARVKREDFPKVGTCARCGREFERTRSNQAICQRCLAEQHLTKWDKPSFVVLTWTTITYLSDTKKERIYVSTNGDVYRVKEGILHFTNYARIPRRYLKDKIDLVTFLKSMGIEEEKT